MQIRKINSILILVIILLAGCSTKKDNYEIVKKFKPDNKYFTATLKSLHFIIETSDIARIDSVFNQIIDRNAIPVSAKGCKDGTYHSESPYDAYDYKHVIKLTIKNEKMCK